MVSHVVEVEVILLVVNDIIIFGKLELTIQL